MTFDVDYVNLQGLAHCYRKRISLPGLISLERFHNVSPAEYLETIAATGKGTCPDSVVEALGLDHHVSVATAARLLLDRLRSTGQLPPASALAPLPISTRDDVEALGQLARRYRAEKPVPTQVRVGGAPISTDLFLSGFAHDRRECPASIASDVGVVNQPSSMREVAGSLHGRLRQAGAL